MTGPLTIRSGAPAWVVVWRWARPYDFSSIAETAATTTRRYAGRHPAITALTAIARRVAAPMAGGTIPITSSELRHGMPDIIFSTRVGVGGMMGRPSVQPRA